MKQIKYTCLLTVVVLLALSSCNDDITDTQKPVINILQPDDHQQFHVGDTIDFEAEFYDNVGLSEVKIDIHYGGDHTHKSARHSEAEWRWDTVVGISGTYAKFGFPIRIPEDVKHGDYDFVVFCTDQAGNETVQVLIIEIEDEEDEH